jgi:O-acetylhomoserine/O-acetylserine sulfhydrylase-like pyridoxal-dependent enzyme
MKPETIAVHGGYSPDPTTKAVAVPIAQKKPLAETAPACIGVDRRPQ